MDGTAELRTGRLLLRRWRASDRGPFADLNAEPEVMEYFPKSLSRAESDRLVERVEDELERRGYGLWALEVLASGEFIGFTGLAPVSFEAHFTPAIEIGWRLARSAWGRGYATEAAVAALAFGFEEIGLDEIVSIAVVENRRSRAVMERIGMKRDPEGDFDHPSLPIGDPLSRHVLYRIAAVDR
jgi:RimJ/RimL family protein N-acetyltransferase